VAIGNALVIRGLRREALRPGTVAVTSRYGRIYVRYGLFPCRYGNPYVAVRLNGGGPGACRRCARFPAFSGRGAQPVFSRMYLKYNTLSSRLTPWYGARARPRNPLPSRAAYVEVRLPESTVAGRLGYARDRCTLFIPRLARLPVKMGSRRGININFHPRTRN
jgi:hypothetical protein